MPDLIRNGELVLYGIVGISDFYDFAGFTALDVMSALAQVSGDLTVRINSPGGIVPEGVSIYHLLKSHPGKVRVVVDAQAVSIASVIAMAGDEIVMPEGTMMMIHAASGVTIGNAKEHRRSADELDHLTRTVAQIYVKRTGLEEAEVLALLEAETWMDGAEAIAKGFATSTGNEDAPIADATMAAAHTAFDYGTYKHAPAPLMALANNRKAMGLPMVAVASAPHNPRKERHMDPTLQADPNNPALTLPAPVISPAPTGAAVMHQATLAERDRINQITSGYRAMRLADEPFLAELISSGKSVIEAKSLMIDKLAALNTDPAAPQINAGPATVTADESDKFVAGVAKSLMHKKGLKGGERNEFSGYRLENIARMSLERRGLKTGSMRPLDMVGQAFVPVMAGGMHTTSDFSNIITTVANVSMLQGFEEAPEAFPEWTRKGTLSDFKTSGRAGLGNFPSLPKVLEGAEYKYVTVADYAEQIRLDTYGHLFAISRQAIINDDMDVFTTVPRRQGSAAKRTVAELVVATLVANPLMGDGVALFHAATHKNLTTGGGSVLSVDSLAAARSKMRLQKTRDGLTILNIRPAILLVPSALETLAIQLISSEVWPGKTNNEPNPVRNMAKVVVEPRLDASSTTAWYLIADPSSADTIEVAYLDGNEEPFLDQKDGWSIDGTEFKVRIDAGVAPLAWEGMQKSAGA